MNLAPETTKGQIMQLLTVKWPLTIAKIHNEITNKNKKTYKATYRAVTELEQEKILEKNKNEYKINEDYLKTNANNSIQLLKAYNAKGGIPSTAVSFSTYKNSDEFYRALILMLQSCKEIRLAAKTPALFLTSELTTGLRAKYAQTLWDKIKKGDPVFYLFSYELTAKLIKDNNDKQALKKISELDQYENLHLRYAPIHSVIAMAISDNQALIGLANPHTTDSVGFIKIEGENFDGLKQLYDTVFSSSNHALKFVKELEKQLKH